MAIDEKVMLQAQALMWSEELSAVNEVGRPIWYRRRVAAEALCDLFGVSKMIKDIQYENLRPPPTWPEVDVIPVGGGPGLVTCEVRTFHPTKGKHSIKIGLKREGKRFATDQIKEALDRGKFQLRKLLE